jgi:protein-glucosylgalactosylhydroxylysine glucosidase
VDGAGISGRALRHTGERENPSLPTMAPSFGKALAGWGRWDWPTSRVLGESAAEAAAKRPALADNRLVTVCAFRARAGRGSRLRQLVSVVCGVMHHQPDQHAARLAAKAKFDGFEAIRRENRAAWDEIWKGRIRLVGAPQKWQALADAAFFYLNSSVHASSRRHQPRYSVWPLGTTTTITTAT